MQSDKNGTPLPAVREDLKLFPGPRHHDGSPSWRILDPVRNQFFEIGWLEFELLARWSEHADAESLIADVEAATPLDPSAEEVEELTRFLAANQLLAPTTRDVRDALRGRLRQHSRPWYETLLHHYLFFRVPLFRPDAFLERTLPAVELFFTRGFGIAVAVAFMLDLFLVMREWHAFRESFVQFFTLQGMFYYALAASFAKVVHELGHAYAAKRHGVRVPAMGVAFLVLWPFLYTDTAETWKLSDRRKQLEISSAGMMSELVLAVFATLLWSICPEGALKTVLFVLATTTWVMTLAINASPFMRFDGYFVLSDALDFPNLHERSSACARWFLRTTFFGLDEPVPEPDLSRRNRAWLILFALVTWVYRLTVFIGIALLVYHLFLKILGIVLMLVEVIWFIARPVVTEIAYLWSQRRSVRIAWKPTGVLVALLLLLMWMLPISSQVSAPAVLRADGEQPVYAPFPSQVKSLVAKPGQRVDAGELLAVLEVPEHEVRWRQAEVTIAAVRAELQRAPASVRQQEQQSVLQERLAQGLAQQQAVREEAARLELRAAHSGVVADVAPDLIEGRWVNSRQMLMRVVADSARLIEMYVSETQVGALERGQSVKFFPEVPKVPVIRGTVLAVDKTPSRRITQPLLASTHGGALSAVQDPREGLIAYGATFRVLVQPSDLHQAPSMALRGVARVETDLRFVAQNFLSRLLSILIRESGF